MLLALHDLHNGSHWKNPDVFMPERFLTKEGNLVQDEWLSPFGNGKKYLQSTYEQTSCEELMYVDLFAETCVCHNTWIGCLL